MKYYEDCEDYEEDMDYGGCANQTVSEDCTVHDCECKYEISKETHETDSWLHWQGLDES